jgi:hypothetical protein
VTWRKKRLWNFSVLQRVHLSNLIFFSRFVDLLFVLDIIITLSEQLTGGIISSRRVMQMTNKTVHRQHRTQARRMLRSAGLSDFKLGCIHISEVKGDLFWKNIQLISDK